MTTFALVQRETRRKGSGTVDCSTEAPRVNNDVVENELRKHDIITTRQIRKPRKHAVQEFHGDSRKTRYTSRIGLIYLNHVVGYTVTVYLHSKNDYNEEHRNSPEGRYEFVRFMVNLVTSISWCYFFLMNVG